MSQSYRQENASVSLLNYHFVWIPRRRSKVLKGEIATRLAELIRESIIKLDCKLISLAIEDDHVHLFINTAPHLAPIQIIHQIKGYSARVLRKEFPELMRLPSMWTRSYFVSTAGNVSSETVKRYIENQGTR